MMTMVVLIILSSDIPAPFSLADCRAAAGLQDDAAQLLVWTGMRRTQKEELFDCLRTLKL
ncbi:hypothetical protein BN135_1617 [Cronobacter muytjensii 530]